MIYQNKHRYENKSNGVGDEDVVAGVGWIFPKLSRNQHRRHDLLRHVRVVLHVEGRDIGRSGFKLQQPLYNQFQFNQTK